MHIKFYLAAQGGGGGVKPPKPPVDPPLVCIKLVNPSIAYLM